MNTSLLRYFRSEALEFLKTATGASYFHETPRLGLYFTDQCSYYYDLRVKVNWKGATRNGIPLLYDARRQEHFVFPITVLQYGLGAIDEYNFSRKAHERDIVGNVGQWIGEEVQSGGLFNSQFHRLLPRHDLHSSNSAMTLGHALSFISRYVRLDVANMRERKRLLAYGSDILKKMLKPLHAGGTMLSVGTDLYLCEVCRQDGYVVLNGWIFALFGLQDYFNLTGDAICGKALDDTLSTMKRVMPAYELPDGWSFYDNKGRVCSANYHAMQCVLVTALNKLYPCTAFARASAVFNEANKLTLKGKYTLIKIRQKLGER